jgi:hypothetical protein
MKHNFKQRPQKINATTPALRRICQVNIITTQHANYAPHKKEPKYITKPHKEYNRYPHKMIHIILMTFFHIHATYWATIRYVVPFVQTCYMKPTPTITHLQIHMLCFQINGRQFIISINFQTKQAFIFRFNVYYLLFMEMIMFNNSKEHIILGV